MAASSSMVRSRREPETPSCPPAPVTPIRIEAMRRMPVRTHISAPWDRSSRCTFDRLLEIGEQLSGRRMINRQHPFLSQQIETRRGIDPTQCLLA